MSSFVEPIAEESNEQFVYDDKEKDVNVPDSNLSHKQVFDVVIQFEAFETHKDVSHLQLVLQLENLTERKIVEQSYNQMQLTLDSISQNILEIQTENLENSMFKSSKGGNHTTLCVTLTFFVVNRKKLTLSCDPCSLFLQWCTV